MTEKWFEKSNGNVDIYEKQLPARLNLRPLASIPAICLLAFSLICGKLWCGVAFAGPLIMGAMFLTYFMLMALLS